MEQMDTTLIHSCIAMSIDIYMYVTAGANRDCYLNRIQTITIMKVLQIKMASNTRSGMKMWPA